MAAAAAFHNSQPVARLLILGGAVTDHSYRIQEQNILHLGELAGRIMRNFGARFPKAPPDVPTMAVELGASCFRHSYYQHGEIIEAYVVDWQEGDPGKPPPPKPEGFEGAPNWKIRINDAAADNVG